jgi:hypothetical protein
MSISTVEMDIPLAQGVTVTKDTVSVDLSDGRTISVPLAWFPRLLQGSQAERDRWRLVGRGEGVHWQDLDEDLSVEGLIAGRPSGESQSSFARWLRKRGTRAAGRASRPGTRRGHRAR